MPKILYGYRSDDSIWIDRNFAINKLVEKDYIEAAENNAENDKEAQGLAEAYETRLRAMGEEQLTEEYVEKFGDPNRP